MARCVCEAQWVGEARRAGAAGAGSRECHGGQGGGGAGKLRTVGRKAVTRAARRAHEVGMSYFAALVRVDVDGGEVGV